MDHRRALGAYGYLLARTDADAPKHKGISAFILDMSAPGVSVRPLRELTGTSDFNEVFFDGVGVPADAMIGAPGQGWAIANATLAHERTNVGGIVVKLRLAVNALIELASRVTVDGRPAIDSDRVRDRIGQFSAEVEALSALTYANLTRWLRGNERMHDGAMGKLMFSEINLEMARFAVELGGEAGVLVEGDDNALDHGRWQDEWLYARAYTIAGGSSEIMRNLIAERGLGLPRDAERGRGGTSAARCSATDPSTASSTLIRRRNRWRSCSQVNPMPPCTCSAVPATSLAADFA